MAVKRVVDKIIKKVKPTVKVVVTKTESKGGKCPNCSSKGEQCYICTPTFSDRFA